MQKSVGQRNRSIRGLRMHPLAFAGVLVVFLARAGAPPVIQSTATDPCAAPITNPVACENTKPGNPPSQWDLSNGGDTDIVGFATQISVNHGDTVHFKVDTVASSYSITIYRMGYYGGMGARMIATVSPSVPLPQTQPACLGDKTVGLVDCGNWAESAAWAVPADAVSGIYFALLHRNDNGDENHIVFVVRDDSSTSDLLFKTSDTTWEAYNEYGGNSFYGGQSTGSEANGGAGRAFKVSYNRPFLTRNCCAHDWVFGNEYPMVRFLESNGYNVSYISSVDADRSGAQLKQHKVVLSVGHDEYWSGQERTNFEAARDAGVNLAFFSGNEVFWKTRWENSIDSGNEPYRTLVCYKETWANAVIDPQDPPTWTGTWRDPRFSPPADGGRPENALTGTIFTVNCCSSAIQVPYEYAAMRLWRNTAVASLAPGQVATLGQDTLGYEWDEELDNGFRPPGLIDLSSTTVSVPQKLQDYGSAVGPGTATHKLTLYRAPSGALVFGAGTVQWSWGLDSNHDGTQSSTDQSMQQATINLFADMGVQPSTLQSGLVAATKSTDTTPPTSTITSPSSGTQVTDGTQITISGTASDTGGGVVAGVEVSTDGGATWHPAVGRNNWSYNWIANTAGTITIKSRAIDDSANIEASPPSITVTVSCPCSIWSNLATPAVPATNDSLPVEVGLKFQTDTDAGSITGIKFYKGSTNTGTHVAHLWTASGTLLASATFTSETASGWQQVNLPTPVALTANTTYVVSYYAPNGNYSSDSNYFSGGGVDSSPLHALKNGRAGPNGVYHYGSNGGFPDTSFNAANYWVDVIFASGPDQTPPGVMATVPAGNATGVAPTTNLSATFTEAVNPASLSFVLHDPYGNAVSATVTYNSSSFTATLQPSASLTSGSTYSGSVQASDLAGNAMAGPYIWSFTTAGARTCPCSIWSYSSTPTLTTTSDSSALELGVKFQADANGYITGVRFYKGAGNTGTHIGNLWSASGTLLASATFTNETASGWQQVNFDGAVPVAAGTTYVASYFAPNGHYAVDSRYFALAGVDNAPLHALANGISGPNAVFNYGAVSAFPSSSYNASNYWVDVVYNTQGTVDTTPPTVTNTVPPSGATAVAATTAVSATFSEAVQPAAISFQVHDATNTLVGGNVSYDLASHTVTFLPGAELAFNSSYTASVQATDLAGNAMATPVTSSFVTGGPNCPCTLWSSNSAGAAESSDTGSVELGVKFRADISGYITGVRFYKGVDNTGTHVGNLWTSTGTLLASATFAGETASGWQQANFASSVAVSAGTVYVASYFAPSGHYALTSGGFATTGVDAPPLHALASGVAGPDGVFSYGASSSFPTSSYNASNYWVDVVFNTQGTVDTTPPVVTGTLPSNGATGVSSGASVSATFNKAVQPASLSFQVRNPANALVAGNLSYNPASYAATFQPSAGLAFSTTYTASVQAADLSGNAMTAPVIWSFTTGTPSCPCSLWSSATVPSTPETSDGGAVELGVKFRADVNGYVTGVRFYKGADNTGAHVGNLWSSTGALLASATFAGETASGWQQVNFDGAVPVSAGVTYIASYFAPNGHYALASGGFANSGVDAAPLHGLASGADGPNGVYVYAVSSSFPTNSYNASNYWVDVVFNTQGTVDTSPPSVSSTTPANGSAGVVNTTSVSATFNESVQQSSLKFQLHDSANNLVQATISYDPASYKATWQPTAPLAFNQTFTASVQATDLAGNAMADAVTWSFTTGGANCPCSVWSSGTVPNGAESTDTGSVEVGVKFRTDVNGFITGVRFYKGVDNIGTHIGNLWTSSGTLLATATFTGETASGWQQVAFSAPVAVTAGTTYVASYFAPNGHYFLTSGAFGTAGVDSPPLHVLASGVDGPNGVYVYSASSAFPTDSINASNYWIDVIFTTH